MFLLKAMCSELSSFKCSRYIVNDKWLHSKVRLCLGRTADRVFTVCQANWSASFWAYFCFCLPYL